MIEKALKFVKPIIVALVGVYLTNKFNIFSFISFIPADKTFDVCITAYFAFLEILSEFILEVIRTRFLSELSVILSLNNNEVSIDSTPIIRFNSSDLAEATITIQINGRKKHFKNLKLILSSVNFATMQASINNRETSVDNNGNYIIDLERIFGTTDMRTVITSSFRVNFVKEPIEGERVIEMVPEIKNSFPLNIHPLIFYRHNKAILKVEG